MTLRAAGTIPLPGGGGKGFDHADTLLDGRGSRVFALTLGEPPGEGCSASVIAVEEALVVRTIALPGRPRWALYDAASDSVFVNIQAPAVIVRIDAATCEERGRVEVGCDGPHGLGLVDGRLFCAADGGEVVVIDDPAGAARVTRRLPLRGVPDVVWHAG